MYVSFCCMYRDYFSIPANDDPSDDLELKVHGRRLLLTGLFFFCDILCDV